MALVVDAACVVRLRAQGSEQGTKRGLRDRLMLETKEENRLEQLTRERTPLDDPEVFIGNALGGFRGRFPFSVDPASCEADFARRPRKGESRA